MIKIINTAGETLAFLNNAFNAKVREVINGEYTISFSTIIEELKSDYITHENLIECDGQLFQISIYEKMRTNDNKLLVYVMAEQVSYKLLDYMSDDFNYSNISAGAALNELLVGTGFRTGIINLPGEASFEISEATNKREILNLIGSSYNGEFKFDKYIINLLAKRGSNNGVEFRASKNITSIKKKIDNTTKDEEGNPLITYEVDALEVSQIEGYKGLEGIELGDTVRIIDDALGINVLARVLEYEYDPLLRRTSKLVFGNFINTLTDITTNFVAASSLVARRSKVWDRAKAISEAGTIFTDILEGEIKAGQNAVRAGFGSVSITENNGILITDQASMELSTKALRLLGGVIAISNTKDANGNFIYRTFGTGDGFSADEIKAGTLSSERIGAGSITVEKLSQSVIDDISLAIGSNIDLTTNPIILSYGNSISSFDERITINESLIQQNTDAISLKVSKDSIISEINQTAESVKISASKVDITGFVTFTNLSTAGQTTINAGNITTGTLTGVNINVSQDVTVGDELYIGKGSYKTLIKNVNGSGYLYSNNSYASLKFWGSGGDVWVSSNLAIGRGFSIGTHGGITGTTWSSCIRLDQNNITLWSSGSGAATDIYGILTHRGGYLGFFNTAAVTKQIVSAAAAITTPSFTAPSTYAASNFTTVIGQLRTDVTNLRTTLEAVRTALSRLGLL